MKRNNWLTVWAWIGFIIFAGMALVAQTTIHDESDGVFHIHSQVIRVTSPNGGENWNHDSQDFHDYHD